MDLHQLRIFVAVADAAGFAPAARQLRLSPPAVTRAIAALEHHLGARLFHRTTRLVRLTDAGERFLTDARQILADLAQAEATARGAHLEPQGELSLTAPVMFGRLHVAPVLLDYLAQHPKVQARVLFVDRIVPLMDEGIDVALRIASLPDSALTAIQIGTVRPVVVASPDYLARHGEPATPDDLPRHLGIGFARTSGDALRWSFAAPGHPVARETAQPRMPLQVNAADVAIDAAVSGHGLARVASYQVRQHIAEGRLQRVLQAYEPPVVPVHLVYPEGRHAAAKVRTFVDFAAARMRGHPAFSEA